MGNRGILHDADGHIRRNWVLKRWIVCVLEFRGRNRTVMTPNRYTELFFLDEATALAAGHRPCAECRHARFIDFCMAWKAAHLEAKSSRRPTADEMDDRLHTERVAPDRSKRTHPETARGLAQRRFRDAAREQRCGVADLEGRTPQMVARRLPRASSTPETSRCCAPDAPFDGGRHPSGVHT